MWRQLVPEQASRDLTNRLTEHGMIARAYIDGDGRSHVKTAPPEAPMAGTDVLCTPAGPGCAYVSEWGNHLGDAHRVNDVVDHILWLYGRRPSTRR